MTHIMLFHKGKGFFQIVNHFRLIDVGEHTELAAVFGNLFAEDEDEVDHPCFDRQDTAEAARLVEMFTTLSRTLGGQPVLIRAIVSNCFLISLLIRPWELASSNMSRLNMMTARR